jgi:histidinol-phosphatase (PHP family)
MLEQMFKMIGGKFCLSDDSHGVEQVALNYHQCIPYLERNDISCIHFLESSREKLDKPLDSRFPFTRLQSMTIAEFGALPFWQSRGSLCNSLGMDGN